MSGVTEETDVHLKFFRHAYVAMNLTLNQRNRDMSEAPSSENQYVGKVFKQFQVGFSGVRLDYLL